MVARQVHPASTQTENTEMLAKWYIVVVVSLANRSLNSDSNGVAGDPSRPVSAYCSQFFTLILVYLWGWMR